MNDLTLDPWTRTVSIYRVARKAGARLRARDLVVPTVLIPPGVFRYAVDAEGPVRSETDEEFVARRRNQILDERLTRWWEDWTRPMLGRLQNVMAEKLRARMEARARMMGFESTPDAGRMATIDLRPNTTPEPDTFRPEDVSGMSN